ncbi:ABC transporter substrate-binding protein [Mesorhizobium sp. M1C.F.Ca.ET.193.01.1.1]|uniref:amino acid ABC transporter substrate-binding protein n=1 Tax=unclassified Mesorhizobium TaxID=325217 RepID=UPI000FD3CB2E|nr:MULTISPECIES: amino acid ABC transporter substrate-binding protein [unclassified Mesorhizobium]TGS93385.1 ABC transporter substrate-binding protein [bacterium M00.F.Ca.ET.177.01.1.1]TGQ50672.1 ABC transporter substrate-binding protein [Mesorhizobium sp. M1C.F.Ca.ET.210.01.1.1]TGQ65838.1 ABC transporter substrate-binding protein [Mesorhizobium sp. M1C.F.Ca.ET.212.01.1.1]TGQ99843.1 ABC transporter substrate-binding protein [Mesorhizobium sp. M1C.F.Ca.ET.204.01.1.1]TGR20376.1 ABC transporter s
MAIIDRFFSRRRFLGGSAMAITASALGMPSVRTARAQAATFKAGVITSLSGENILGGNLTKQGYDLWADAIKAKGGVEVAGDRFKVEMFYGDDQSSPATGADAAERLIVQNGVDVLFGPYTSGSTIAVQPICQKYQVPMISGSAESPNVWKAKPEFNFGIIPAVDTTSGLSLGVLAKLSNPAAKTVAVISVNEPFSKETGEGFRDGAKAAGLELATYELVPPEGDLTPVISKIAALNPDIVAVGGHEEVLINVVKTSKSLNYRPKALIMHYGITNPAFAQALGADADGTTGVVVWLPTVSYKDDLFGTAKDFAQMAQKKLGGEPDYTAAACAASGLVLGDALKRLGKKPALTPEDRVALKDAIAETDIQTFYGPIKFEKDGPHYHDNIQPVPVLVQIQGGKTVAVGPKEAAAADYIYPLPAWK